MKTKGSIIEQIAGESAHFPMEHRCLNGVCFLAIGALFISVAANHVLELPAPMVAGSLLGGVLFSIYYYFSRYKRIFKPVYWLVLATTCLLLVLLWFYNCGISGPTAFVALIVVSTVNLVTLKWERILSLFLLVLLIAILFLAEYSYPDLVSAYPNRSKEFIDNYISLLMAIFIISFIIHFTLQQFRAERETSEDARVQLKASEAQFRLLVENAPDAIFVQAEGRFAYLNDAALRLFGAASADDLLDKPVMHYFHRDYHETLHERIHLLKEEENAAPLLTAIFLKTDSCPVDVEVSAVPLRFQNKDGALIFVRDISERKAAEENLERQNRLMQIILENIPFGCIYTDTTTGEIAMSNRPAERILRHPPTTPATELKTAGSGALHEDGTPFDPNEYPAVRVLKNGDPVQLEKTDYRTGDGTIIKIKYSAYPIWNADNKMTGVITLFEDITAQLEAEAERQKLETQLLQAQKMESIGRLAGGMAHDFNNLLSIINGYCELILPDLDVDSELHARISQILTAGQRAAALVRQLLAFSRKQILSPEILDVNSLFQGTEKMLRRLIGEDIDLITSYAVDLKKVKADPGQIEQVLMNLAVNARDAMPDGGKLFIETRNIYLDDSYVKSQNDIAAGDYVMIAISDNGTGMDEETLKNIFDPFFTTKDIEKGTGLGLSMVYGTVKQSGGNIRVYSEPDQGTTFKIYLPAAREDTLPEKPKVECSTSLRGAETILVVEDDENVMEIIVQALDSQGYTVFSKTDGKAALEFLTENPRPVHLMLTDVVMPKMNGRQLAEKASGIMPDIRVIYMSGYTDNAIAHHGVLGNGIDFLQKPIMIRDLLETVRSVIDRSCS